MKSFAAPILLIFFSLFINPFCIHAQEENTTAVTQGNRYISLKVKSIDKYNSRIERQQKQLLNKLKRKEKHFAHKLKNSDSLAYAKYKEQRSPSYDSISTISKNDTGTTAANISKQKNATVDSLRGVQSFVQNKSGLPTNSPQSQNTTADLNRVQGKMNFRSYITQLITQRTNSLKNLSGSEENNLPGLKGIEKQVFYGKSKMNVYKEMEEDPTKAEDKSMEYLQGTPGFDKYMKNATQEGGASFGGSGSSGDMEKMGFQTKGLLQNSLQQKFGSNLSGVSKQFSNALSQWKETQKDIADAKSTKQSIKQLGRTNKPSFKVNPMRGLPFWKRIQKQYTWQATRASADGKHPAMMEPSVMYGFKQTPKLVYGVGMGTAIGLGQSWQTLHLSYQGLGLKSFTTWQWQYGIGTYAGYERTYNQYAFTKKTQNRITDVPLNPHNTSSYNESVLIGLTKSYRINNKYNGQIQVLYDIWWREKGLDSPVILRFATIKI